MTDRLVFLWVMFACGCLIGAAEDLNSMLRGAGAVMAAVCLSAIMMGTTDDRL